MIPESKGGIVVDASNREFFLEEYRSIRTEIIERMKLDQQIQRNANLTIAGLIALYYSADFNLDHPIILLLAAIMCFYALFQQSRFKVWAGRLGAYSKQLEDAFTGVGAANELGWEGFTSRERELEKENANGLGFWRLFFKSIKTGRVLFSSTQLEATYWVTLLILLLALFGYEVIT